MAERTSKNVQKGRNQLSNFYSVLAFCVVTILKDILGEDRDLSQAIYIHIFLVYWTAMFFL